MVIYFFTFLNSLITDKIQHTTAMERWQHKQTKKLVMKRVFLSTLLKLEHACDLPY